MSESPTQVWDVNAVMGALRRVDADWPSPDDIAFYRVHERFPVRFENDDASAAIEKYHARDLELERIRDVCRVTKDRALHGFIEQHLTALSDYQKRTIRLHIEGLLMSPDFASLDSFLTGLAGGGYKKAIADIDKRNRGRTIGHVGSGLLALTKICVLVLILNACERGFQTIVVAGLGLLYSSLTYYLVQRNYNAAVQFTSVVFDTARIRKLLRDRPLRWEAVTEQQKTLNEEFAKNEVRLYIWTAMLAVMQLICAVALIYTSI